jgi:hypothetical protein
MVYQRSAATAARCAFLSFLFLSAAIRTYQAPANAAGVLRGARPTTCAIAVFALRTTQGFEALSAPVSAALYTLCRALTFCVLLANAERADDFLLKGFS